MSFTDDVREYRVKLGCRCSVGVWRAAQSSQTRDEMDAVMADPQVTGKAIWAAMRSRGYVYNCQAVTRHRAGDCACPSLTT